MKLDYRVGIIGLGYVGLPLLKHLGSCGATVVGYDIDSRIVTRLEEGISHIPDVSEEALKNLLDGKIVEFTTSPQKLQSCNVIVVCVPTPIDSKKQIDLRSLKSAVETIRTNMRPGTILINESTSFPGTLRQLFWDEMEFSKNFSSCWLASAPERIDPGNGIPIQNIPRVVGGINDESTDRAAQFYRSFFNNVHAVSSPEIAEMSKLLENTFRFVNISMINELNDLCRRVDIDMREVIDAASTKPYGFMRFSPSAGIGGHCIPVDPEYLQYFARVNKAPCRMIEVAAEINESMAYRILERVKSNVPMLKSKKILLLGVSYKPNVSDVRETPAASILRVMKENACEVNWYDPLVSEWNGEKSTQIDYGEWDLGLVITGHDALNLISIKQRCEVVFDLTGKFNADAEVVQI